MGRVSEAWGGYVERLRRSAQVACAGGTGCRLLKERQWRVGVSHRGRGHKHSSLLQEAVHHILLAVDHRVDDRSTPLSAPGRLGWGIVAGGSAGGGGGEGGDQRVGGRHHSMSHIVPWSLFSCRGSGARVCGSFKMPCRAVVTSGLVLMGRGGGGGKPGCGRIRKHRIARNGWW